MAKKKLKKYMRMLITMPDEVCEEFMQHVPNGERSRLISGLVKDYIIKKFPQKTSDEKNFWDEIDELKKHRKGDYSHEDSVKTAKDAWKYID